METIKATCYKGTRILLGNRKRDMINGMISTLVKNGYQEISIPIIQSQEMFAGKVGEENKKMMFNFTDRGDREICLAPEYTAVIQLLSRGIFKYRKDLKVFYLQECFRGESPQEGRYRQFTQLGVEIINPTKDYSAELALIARNLILNSLMPMTAKYYSEVLIPNLKSNLEVPRGLDYYKEGRGFEISYELLGAQKQICGGGMYDGGIGFAIGVDRLLLIDTEK